MNKSIRKLAVFDTPLTVEQLQHEVKFMAEQMILMQDFCNNMQSQLNTLNDFNILLQIV